MSASIDPRLAGTAVVPENQQAVAATAVSSNGATTALPIAATTTPTVSIPVGAPPGLPGALPPRLLDVGAPQPNVTVGNAEHGNFKHVCLMCHNGPYNNELNL